jgi:heavy metal translocating P-type ATPase
LHCGLAVPASGEYCCYGCELAATLAAEGAQREARTKGALTFSLLLSMAVMMLSLFLYAEDVYGAAPGAGLGWLRQAYRVASAALSAPVMILLGLPLARRAARSARSGQLTMDLLVVTGAFAAFGLSLAGVISRRGVYFDSATSALLLATLGRYLEATARAKASRMLGPLLELARGPVLAGPERGELALISPALVAAGMRVRVDVEGVLPVDARLVGGPVEVNLGVLTGEAVPVTLQVGAEVPAGAVPVSGPMECVALRASRASTLERLAGLARDLHARPSPLKRAADAFAAAIVPIVFTLAIGTFVGWAAAVSIERAAIVALAVVLAACPCTYGVATPLALWLGLRRALEAGVCIRDAKALEALARVNIVAFDKTATLTERDLEVLEVEVSGGATRAEALALAAALDAGSRHPVATALVALAAREGAGSVALAAARLEVGRGATGVDGEGRALVLGSRRFLREHGVEVASPAALGPDVRVALAREGIVIARFRIGESLRAEAARAIEALRADGVQTLMLTGDTAPGARSVAESLGIPYFAALSPEDKVERVRLLGDRAAMVGDGLNDAPALAGPGPSFAVSGGTDLARCMAQVTLLRPDLRLVPWTLALARRTRSIARRNLGWATAYNGVFLLLAMSGALRPVWAGLSMLTSSLLTLASSLRVSTIALPAPERAP